MSTTNGELHAATSGVKAPLGSLENTVVGQGRQLSELAVALQSLQNMQRQSTEC